MDALAQVIGDSPPSPLMPEWVGVQTPGLGIWLGLEISRRTGIWANVNQPYPRVLIETIFHSVMGEACPDTSRFAPESLSWSVMALLPSLAGRPEFQTLSAYLSDDPNGLKLFQLAGRIADTFDRYVVYRPEMVLKWENGGGNGAEAAGNDWQPVLWRALVERHGPSHVAAAAYRLLDLLRHGIGRFQDLPRRISLFGISTLPPLYLSVLAALAKHVAIHLFLLNPSREYWAYIRSKREVIRALSRIEDGAVDMEAALYMEEGHPLLSSLGTLGRDFQCVLEDAVDYVEGDRDLYADPAQTGAGDLLHMVQSDILNLRLRGAGETPALPVRPKDESIRVHSCHGSMREVQVLYDQLLNMFQQDETLLPHEVIVMVPDITEYAPVIDAVFSVAASSGVSIPYTISDRGGAQESPVVQALFQLLKTARSRMQIQDVLDLLAIAPVRRRFGLSIAEMELATHWMVDVGIRWAISASHRALWGQPELHQNTWRFGLDRLLLGVAMPEAPPALFGGTFPYPGIEGKETETLGKVVDFCETLFPFVDRLRETGTPKDWRDLLLEVLSSMTADDNAEAFAHQMIRDTLTELALRASLAGFESPISPEVMHLWLVNAFKQRPSVRGFLSGGVTFCNLLPMRSIPFKVVCLMGINDSVFPRSKPPAGFDLAAIAPKKGDRSVRNDDRYLFLEALLSARNRFLLFYVGQAVRDNTPIPPSVVVSELLDCLEEGFYLKTDTVNQSGASLREHLVVRHPLQPFDAAYFRSGDAGLLSYSEAYLAGAVALAGARVEVSPFFSAPLPQAQPSAETIHLADLERFFRMPVAFLLAHRLGVVFPEQPGELEKREPLSLSGLIRHQAGELLLAGQVYGRSFDEMTAIIRGQGMLPPGTSGECETEEIRNEILPVYEAVLSEDRKGVFPPLAVSVDIDGVRVIGEITDLFPSGRISFTFGAVTARRKLSLWLSHLLLNCSDRSDFAKTSVLIGRKQAGAQRYELGPVREKAISLMRDLIALYRLGNTQVLPFFPVASYSYASAFLKADPADAASVALAAARKRWRGGEHAPGAEGDHPAVRRVYGDMDPLREGDAQPELSFQALALRVCAPLIAAEIEPKRGGR